MKGKLHLGCGKKILEGYVNLDIVESEGVDVVQDVTKGLPFEDNSFEEVLCIDFLEHIAQEKVIFVINEIWRVMKDRAILKIHVPEAPGVTAFQDPTHRSYWNEETFTYFIKKHPRREYCSSLYGINAMFKMKSIAREERLTHKYAVSHGRTVFKIIKMILGKDFSRGKYKKVSMSDYLLNVELIAVKNEEDNI